MSQDRFLQSFCALLGAVVLVASVHVFLLATSEPRLEAEAEIKTATLPEAAPVAASTPSIAPEVQAAEVAPEAGADLVATQGEAEAEIFAAQSEAETVALPAEAELVAPEEGAHLPAPETQPADAPAPEQPEPARAVAAETQAAPPAESAPLAEIAEADPAEAEIAAAALLEAAATGHSFVSEPPVPDDVAATQEAESVPAATQVAEAVPVAEEPSDDAAAPSSLEELLAETIGASADAPVDLAASTALDEADSPAPPAVPTFEADEAVTGSVDQLPAITIPLRKPQAPVAAPEPVKTAEKAAPDKIGERVERRQTADADSKKPLWKPMTLGFGKDKKRQVETPAPKQASAPEAAPKKAQPASSGAYRAKVWAKLARHKPRLGKPGSTSVVFVIGPSGALRSARVGRSSGNAQLDQTALAAVRAASPFPAPPAGLGAGALTFSIQIYFR